MGAEIQKLNQTIKDLRKENEDLREEIKSLWFMLDEYDNSSKAIGEALQEAVKDQLEEEIFKSLKTVGDA
jgi:ABC-type transporter Mla subunit MlaD